MIKKTLCFIISAVFVISLCACSGIKTYHTDTDQLALPKAGEEIAVMHTSKGDVYFRLFPDDAPKAVESFKALANQKKYDGVKIFRSEANYLLQSGDFENNNGTGGKSKWGSGYEVEVSDSLNNIRGALGMAHGGDYKNGSQFYIVTRGYASVAYTEKLKDSNPDLAEKYEQNGGIPELDGDYTVFGQAFWGLDVLDALNAVETDEDNHPTEDIYILSVRIVGFDNSMTDG